MFRRSVIAVGVLVAACSSDQSAPIRVAPTLLIPHALLDSVTKLTVTVINSNGGAVGCDNAGNPTGDTSKPILTKDLTSGSCANGAKFCGDLQITESNDVLVFAAAGYDANNVELATGCATATINQDAQPLSITMKRFIAPANCGDGVVQPTEQCEGGSATDTVCDDTCHTKEILLSGGHGTSGTTANGKVGDKTNPTFVWPATSGDGGRFVAFFGDASPPSFTKVTARVLGDDLEPYTKQGAELAGFSFFMPHDPGEAFPPTAGPDNQLAPAGATVGGSYYTAFQDDGDSSSGPANGVDVHLRSMDSIFTAGQTTPFAVNGAEAGKQDLPTMAANSAGTLLVEWQDEATGSIKARTFNPSGSVFGTTQEISTGSGNTQGVVASNGTGWVVVWQSGNDIKVRTLGADGTPLSAEQTVNDASHTGQQSHPWVAGLSDGRFAVVWNDRNSQDIFLQRFSASAQPVAGDQTSALNNVVSSGDQNAPTIGASSAAGGSFVAAWADGGTGHIRARLIGGASGFLFNNVDGQSDEFQASVADGHTRANPAVAVGGSGPFVAIGWEDRTAGSPGIYVRRFPLPGN